MKCIFPDRRIIAAGVFILTIAIAAAAASSSASPEWRHAVSHKLKIMGGVLIGDEFGTFWDERLPEDWAWFKNYEEYAKFKAANLDYLELEQLFPKIENGRVIFEFSKWNYLNTGLRRMSEKDIVQELIGFTRTPDLRFRTDPKLAEVQSEFRNLEETAIGSKNGPAAGDMPFNVNAAGLFVLKTTSGKHVKILTETYGGVLLVAASSLDGKPRLPELDADRLLLRNTAASWSFDFDGDGKDDLRWTPRTEKEPYRYSALAGAGITVIRFVSF